MNIKTPACYDVSHWKEITDFTKVDPKPLLFITKASEGISLVDEKFNRFASGMMEIECLRGFYHFNRKLYGGKQQAEHFLNVISKQDILSTDLLILDVEEGGEKISQLWVWFELVRKAYPDNLLMLYSRKNILDPIVMTAGEKEYFKDIWTWTAGYPWFPDLYSVCPSGYIPDQSKFGPVGLWQYSSHGRVEGITTELGKPTDVDLNWINPIFAAQLGNNLGVSTMAIYIGQAVQKALTYESAGGKVLPTELPAGTKIIADDMKNVSGINYFHLTSPIQVWTKVKWFQYTEDKPTEPPPPPPPPPPAETFPLEIGVTIGTETKIYVPR